MSSTTKNENAVQLIYCVVRYGQIIGCYANQSDAAQVQSISIAKGQICDIVVKPILNSLTNGNS